MGQDFVSCTVLTHSYGLVKVFLLGLTLTFDRINFVFPCSWDGTSIIVLDEYRINPPYDAVTIMQDCDGSGIDRVIKVVSNH